VAALSEIKRAEPQHIVVVSSTLLYGASFRNPGMMKETRNLPPSRLSSISQEWHKLETEFRTAFSAGLTILRAAPCPLVEPDSLFGQLLKRREMPRFRLFDPPLQFLHPNDLAHAIRAVMEHRLASHTTYNIAPSLVISPSLLVREHGWKKADVSALVKDIPQLNAQVKDLFRHPWTASYAAALKTLGYRPSRSAQEALGVRPPSAKERAMLDPFGMELRYIKKRCAGIAGFLHDRYFRIEYDGEQNLPRSKRGILVGIHRGFMPFDGLMLLNYFYTRHNAPVRILTHHALFKNPIPFNYRKLGGIPPTADNMDAVLQLGHWVGVFPEGVEGAFKYYKDAYKVGHFGRSEFVACAVRNQVPIVPFVTIGSAEIFPVLAKFHWKWLQRKTLWPCFPIAPPFPLLPVPLPVKWKTVFLEPVHVEQTYSPTDAHNQDRLIQLEEQIRTRIQAALLELRAARKTWWR
jgi:1-acyl-sn-glycerol-3-phosphate acyltransferase